MLADCTCLRWDAWKRKPSYRVCTVLNTRVQYWTGLKITALPLRQGSKMYSFMSWTGPSSQFIQLNFIRTGPASWIPRHERTEIWNLLAACQFHAQWIELRKAGYCLCCCFFFCPINSPPTLCRLRFTTTVMDWLCSASQGQLVAHPILSPGHALWRNWMQY